MPQSNVDINVRTKGGRRAQRILQKVGKAATNISLAFTAIGFAAKKALDAYGEQELAEKKLEAAIGRRSRRLLEQAAALQRVSMFGDEVIISAQAMLGAFIKDTRQLELATKATLDLAAAKGMDLVAAADLVGKTLGSTTNALSRYGIVVEGSVGSTKRLETLVKNINVAFGGQAEAQVRTYTGAVKRFHEEFGDLMETFGEELAPGAIKTLAFLREIIETAKEAKLAARAVTVLNIAWKVLTLQWEEANQIAKDFTENNLSLTAKLKDQRDRLAELKTEVGQDDDTGINAALSLAASNMEMLVIQTQSFNEKLKETKQKLKGVSNDLSVLDKKMETTYQELAPLAFAISQPLQQAFSDTLYGFSSFADSLVQGFADMLNRIATTIASQAIIFQFFNMISGGLFGNAVGAGSFIFSGTPFAALFSQHGSSFRVPGQGGPDSQFVPLMATPGETVTVTNNINIHGSNQTQQLMRALNKYGRGVAS